MTLKGVGWWGWVFNKDGVTKCGIWRQGLLEMTEHGLGSDMLDLVGGDVQQMGSDKRLGVRSR